mmetsp:Transcript_4372/g.10697  ORF Transcript_4372/g.10697 Transcript_4372/m.10697 type:complete len:287 (-) Transcript_4372:583-1443(-)
MNVDSFFPFALLLLCLLATRRTFCSASWRTFFQRIQLFLSRSRAAILVVGRRRIRTQYGIAQRVDLPETLQLPLSICVRQHRIQPFVSHVHSVHTAVVCRVVVLAPPSPFLVLRLLLAVLPFAFLPLLARPLSLSSFLLRELFPQVGGDLAHLGKRFDGAAGCVAQHGETAADGKMDTRGVAENAGNREIFIQLVPVALELLDHFPLLFQLLHTSLSRQRLSRKGLRQHWRTHSCPEEIHLRRGWRLLTDRGGYRGGGRDLAFGIYDGPSRRAGSSEGGWFRSCCS